MFRRRSNVPMHSILCILSHELYSIQCSMLFDSCTLYILIYVSILFWSYHSMHIILNNLFIHLTLCFFFHLLHFIHFALWTLFYASSYKHLLICILISISIYSLYLFSFYSIHLILCISLYTSYFCISSHASHYMHLISCISFNASHFMHLIICISFYIFHSIHLFLCILLYFKLLNYCWNSLETNRPTNQRTDIATYIAAIAAKNIERF